MKRPRMWMQVGTWPPPAAAQPRANEGLSSKRVAAMLCVVALLGALAGSLATVSVLARAYA